jgi:hypothetical protein
MNYAELTRWPIGHNSIEVVIFEDGLKRVYFRNGDDAYQLASNLAELDAVITALQKARARFEHPCAVCRAWAEDDEEEKPKTLYNWNNAPEWAMFGCVDSDKSGWWFEQKPFYNQGIEAWGEDGKTEVTLRYLDMADDDILHDLPAADSLEKRPD